MNIALFTNDLMFQSRISQAVRSDGNQLLVARSLDQLKERLGEQPLHSAILDLSFRSLDVGATLAALKATYPSMVSIAYGPHVDVDALQGAREAGVDHVLTRGQFDRDMAQWLRVGGA
jgi:DNA-binding NtrC family response regulator